MELFEAYFLRVAVLLVSLYLLTEILNWNPLDISNFQKSLPFQPIKLYFLLFWSCWAILGRWKEFTTGRQTTNSHPFYWFSQLNMSLNIKSKYTSGKIFRSWFKWLISNAFKSNNGSIRVCYIEVTRLVKNRDIGGGDEMCVMLVTVSAIFVVNMLYHSTLTSGTNFEKMSPISKFCHKHPWIVANIQKLSQTSKNCCQHPRLAINIHLSSRSLLPSKACTQ